MVPVKRKNHNKADTFETLLSRCSLSPTQYVRQKLCSYGFCIRKIYDLPDQVFMTFSTIDLKFYYPPGLIIF